MNITELERLAKAVLNETAPYVKAEAQQNFRFVTNPKAVLQLIELLREMGEALDRYVEYKDEYIDVLLAKYKEMTK